MQRFIIFFSNARESGSVKKFLFPSLKWPSGTTLYSFMVSIFNCCWKKGCISTWLIIFLPSPTCQSKHVDNNLPFQLLLIVLRLLMSVLLPFERLQKKSWIQSFVVMNNSLRGILLSFIASPTSFSFMYPWTVSIKRNPCLRANKTVCLIFSFDIIIIILIKSFK